MEFRAIRPISQQLKEQLIKSGKKGNLEVYYD